MRVSTLVFVSILFAASTARAQHDDVVPYEFGGKVATGGHDDVLGTDHVVERVFGYDFGEDLMDPFVIGDPGFNNGAFAIGVYPNDGLLPANKTLGFNVLTNLQYWDGTGGVSFAAAPVDVELGLRRGSNTVLVSGTGQSGTVPTIGSTGPGRLHVHLESQLNYTDGTDPDPPNAPDGIYLVALELALPDSGLADSDPIYVVYNSNLDEEVHDAAIDWVQENLVPEPASWALMAAALAALAASGWRKRGGVPLPGE
ncbi:MAG: PEP-CTERM sorting domain-containing protein [Pirellulales bacterium]